ncbi:D-alanine--D-alanine ligase [Exiguobacterium sp. SL-10]|jgi:D-alanine-D-alanine ligase|uniref:D-alanine--D-alanine ligase n=1 Tax=Exiguobacterium sp. 11-28 TaxID=1088856 RepID=G4XHI8_9BACL|nr:MULTISPECIES: D-alanine--D-alanine ligase [unclassified Exiguobacterium]AEP19888.1 D-alanine D-alanine ligase [Exiguobacterium sp. 11-28]TCI23146.1 D-alanine--D-alanine ligase [Exiguobacterium sp. SL-9]TCI31913.1 D-alanine--D-alanine ligase [Exiguobacterium sp. SL-10]
MKVAVLYGGVSGEREVSLTSGKGMIEALEERGHEVVAIDFHPDRADELLTLQADVVVSALHGKYGEDGRVQSLLEMAGLPYTGSGVLASALAMDKARAKIIFAAAGIRIARDVLIETGDDIDAKIAEWGAEFPCVVKPAQEGSSNGLTIAMDEAMLRQGIDKAFACDTAVLVEQYIKGRELTVPVLGNHGAETALPVIEIIPKNEFYDYESKYSEGGSIHVCPAELPDALTEEVQTAAIKAHRALGCSGYSRSDFLVSETGLAYILETNTLPGMTPLSLFPDSARAVGISYGELLERFIELALDK